MKKKTLVILVLLPLTVLTIFSYNVSVFVRAASKSLATILAENSNEGTAKEEVLELNDRVQEHKKKIQEISSKIDEYQQKINAKRREVSTLETTIAILDNRVAKIELEMEQTKEEMDSANLEIQALDIQIQEKEKQVKRERAQVAEGIRQIDRVDQRNHLEMLFLNNSFSEFFEEVAELEGIYSKLGLSINRLKSLEAELTGRRENIDGKRLALEKLKIKLEENRETLLESQQGKETLLLETQQTSQKFQQIVSSLRNEQNQIDDELGKAEEALRERLKNSDLAISPDQVILSWPVDPGRGITAYFHDPDYPFRYVFEHPAIDIRAFQGTPVKSAAAGYVARVKNGGAKGYSYIMIVHGGSISTVYGHLSRLDVGTDTFVARGQIIGLSGGAPRTSGAGPLTTGAHLHFETRLSGVPVDPLKYLIR